jgi:nucleotide-binding universal stress UspA family protein
MSRDTVPGVFRSILCAVDFSSNSRAALRYAAMVARLSEARLIVLHVQDPLLATVAASRPDADAILAAAERDLRRVASAALGHATPRVSTTLLMIAGKPAREIVEAADRHNCDLIVMGYRGAGHASRLLFGSTTDGVLRTTTLPVLAIPPSRRRARLPVERTRLRRVS